MSSTPRGRLRTLSAGGAAGALLVALGAVLGARTLSDNSFLTHLATGRVILGSGSVPSADVYTFTAQGEPWVVQSWLASWLYATAEALGGLGLVRVLVALVFAITVGLLWTLTGAVESLVPRLALAALAILASAEQWSERPLMIGLTCFGATMIAAQGRLDPRWLVPIGWVWANSHGSFPLAFVYLIVSLAGARLDGEAIDREKRSLLWLLVGILCGTVGPLGPRLLLFPLEILGKRDVLATVVEWQAPEFVSLGERAFLLLAALAVVVLARKTSWRDGLLVAVFLCACLLGSRNIAIAVLVLVPVIASRVPRLGSLSAGDRGRTANVMALTAAALAVVLLPARLAEPDLDLSRYPVASLAWLEHDQVDLETIRMAAPDYAGNLLELIYGPGERVFYDDRFDMFPDHVSQANLVVTRAQPGLFVVLRDLDVDLVLFPVSSAVARVFPADPAWRTIYLDQEWMIACRRGAPLGPSSC